MNKSKIQHYIHVNVIKDDDKAQLPAKMSNAASGYDLFSIEENTLSPGKHKMFDTGLILEIPRGYEGQIRSRSGLALKHGIVVLNSPGTIDSDYRGRVGVILQNFGDVAFGVHVGDRIAQLVICELPYVDLQTVMTFENTERQSGGFGSTGVSDGKAKEN